MQNLDYDTQTIITKELRPGERLIWCGKPNAGLAFRPIDAFFIPFSLVWAIGATSFFFSKKGSAPFPFNLIEVFFLLAAFYIVIGRFIIDIVRRTKTWYGLTEERIIIISGVFSTTVNSFQLKSLQDISLKLKSDGSGTITLGPRDIRQSWLTAIQIHGMQGAEDRTLEFIPNARQVYEQILSKQSK